MHILQGLNIDSKNNGIIPPLYWNQELATKIHENVSTNNVDIERVVHQRCAMSAYLFTI